MGSLERAASSFRATQALALPPQRGVPPVLAPMRIRPVRLGPSRPTIPTAALRLCCTEHLPSKTTAPVGDARVREWRTRERHRSLSMTPPARRALTYAA